MSLFSRKFSNTATIDAPPAPSRAEMVKQLTEVRAHVSTETERLKGEEVIAEAAFNEAKLVYDAALLRLLTVRGELQSIRWSGQAEVIERRLRANVPAMLQSALADVKDAYRASIDSDWQLDSKLTNEELVDHRRKLQAAQAALEDLALLDLDDADLEARIAAIAVGVSA